MWGAGGTPFLRPLTTLTENRHPAHSGCQRGNVLWGKGRFACRVDTESASDGVCVSTWQSAQKKEGDLSHLDFLVTPFWLLGAIAPASNAEISLSRSYMPWVQWPMSRPRSFYSALRLHRGRDVPALRAGPARMSSWMDSLTWPHTLELGQHSIEELAG